ncbi:MULTISPECIES: 2-isopropylmalate synthase [Gammaproteobacteria]|uniref:2-isopropylmalate synthase n=1 Tax=Vreelandella halophila TaxID=86177 RepID=A0A9X4Y9K8_9GAMM|nr:MULTISPECIES: 2-isopropylmalate synthase [Gammaproteobacteria]KAA8985338.1 2-isopropylmalate synthase [Halospina sp. K52047b]MYL25757.1 2-isopropylmalate synthase [Halomonas utahensis]MYL75703.1 2-isopropylmalate synthase [Halomonas sp. 22501_18_FS]
MAFDHRRYRPFKPLNKSDRRWPDKVIEKAPTYSAVDLRDGNQALVKPMNIAQKQRLFDLLVKLGYKQIEIGFPAASQPDFDFCRKLISEDRIPEDVSIQILTQARPDLIKRSFEALDGVHSAIVHVYNSTSTAQREQVFEMDMEGVKQIAVDGAKEVQRHAKNYPDTEWIFQYSPESFSATEVDYAVEVVDAVNDVWRPDRGQQVIINLPATVEMATPNVFADQIEWFCDHVRYRDHFSLSVHTHNDRGCAIAAAELAVMAGADRVEGTLLGNGERTGNMDLVAFGMNLYSQGIDPEVDLSGMAEIVDVVEACTEIATHPRHPWAGELVFTAFSGSHQDAIRKCMAKHGENDIWNVAYLPIDPKDIGRRYEEVVRINSQSGKGGVAMVLERDYGISLPRWLQIEFAKVVQKEAEITGGEVDSSTIHKLFERDYLQVPKGWTLHTYDLHRTDDGVQASVVVGNGERTELKGGGQGAVEAVVDALQHRHGVKVAVEAYDEFALGEGTSANALACIRIQVNGEVYSAAALAEDTTSATLQALLSSVARCVNATAVDTAAVL